MASPQRRPPSKLRFISDLSQCLYDFVIQLLPPPDELNIKEDVRKLLERLIRTIEPNSRLLAFGSTANGFSLRNSDMDLCCLIDSAERLNASDLVTMLADLLERETKFHVKPLPHARIPIVKLSLDPAPGLPFGIACDIGFENRLAIENTRLLYTYAKIDPTRLRTLVLFLKIWSKRRKINSPYKGTLSSYGYVLLVIYFLVHVKNPPVLPNLQQMPAARPINKDDTTINGYNVWFFDDTELLTQRWHSENAESVAELLIEFFRYFSRDFSYNTGVASIRAGLLKKESKGWQNDLSNQRFPDARERNRLCIEDPFETDYNVARCVTKDGLYTIRGEFMRGSRILSARPERAIIALAELCEERKVEDLVVAPPSRQHAQHRNIAISTSTANHQHATQGGGEGFFEPAVSTPLTITRPEDKEKEDRIRISRTTIEENVVEVQEGMPRTPVTASQIPLPLSPPAHGNVNRQEEYDEQGRREGRRHNSSPTRPPSRTRTDLKSISPTSTSPPDSLPSPPSPTLSSSATPTTTTTAATTTTSAVATSIHPQPRHHHYHHYHHQQHPSSYYSHPHHSSSSSRYPSSPSSESRSPHSNSQFLSSFSYSPSSQGPIPSLSQIPPLPTIPLSHLSYSNSPNSPYSYSITPYIPQLADIPLFGSHSHSICRVPLDNTTNSSDDDKNTSNDDDDDVDDGNNNNDSISGITTTTTSSNFSVNPNAAIFSPTTSTFAHLHQIPSFSHHYQQQQQRRPKWTYAARGGGVYEDDVQDQEAQEAQERLDRSLEWLGMRGDGFDWFEGHRNVGRSSNVMVDRREMEKERGRGRIGSHDLGVGGSVDVEGNVWEGEEVQQKEFEEHDVNVEGRHRRHHHLRDERRESRSGEKEGEERGEEIFEDDVDSLLGDPTQQPQSSRLQPLTRSPTSGEDLNPEREREETETQTQQTLGFDTGVVNLGSPTPRPAGSGNGRVGLVAPKNGINAPIYTNWSGSGVSASPRRMRMTSFEYRATNTTSTGTPSPPTSFRTPPLSFLSTTSGTTAGGNTGTSSGTSSPLSSDFGTSPPSFYSNQNAASYHGANGSGSGTGGVGMYRRSSTSYQRRGGDYHYHHYGNQHHQHSYSPRHAHAQGWVTPNTAATAAATASIAHQLNSPLLSPLSVSSLAQPHSGSAGGGGQSPEIGGQTSPLSVGGGSSAMFDTPPQFSGTATTVRESRPHHQGIFHPHPHHTHAVQSPRLAAFGVTSRGHNHHHHHYQQQQQQQGAFAIKAGEGGETQQVFYQTSGSASGRSPRITGTGVSPVSSSPSAYLERINNPALTATVNSTNFNSPNVGTMNGVGSVSGSGGSQTPSPVGVGVVGGGVSPLLQHYQAKLAQLQQLQIAHERQQMVLQQQQQLVDRERGSEESGEVNVLPENLASLRGGLSGRVGLGVSRGGTEVEVNGNGNGVAETEEHGRLGVLPPSISVSTATATIPTVLHRSVKSNQGATSRTPGPSNASRTNSPVPPPAATGSSSTAGNSASAAGQAKGLSGVKSITREEEERFHAMATGSGKSAGEEGVVLSPTSKQKEKGKGREGDGREVKMNETLAPASSSTTRRPSSSSGTNKGAGASKGGRREKSPQKMVTKREREKSPGKSGTKREKSPVKEKTSEKEKKEKSLQKASTAGASVNGTSGASVNTSTSANGTGTGTGGNGTVGGGGVGKGKQKQKHKRRNGTNTTTATANGVKSEPAPGGNTKTNGKSGAKKDATPHTGSAGGTS